MNNPFELIDVRLTTIENLLVSLKQVAGNGSSPLEEQPITVKELSQFLGVTEPTLIRWRKKGKIPFLQLGSRILFQKSKVVSALSANKERGLK